MQSQISNPYMDQLVRQQFNKAMRQGTWRTLVSWISRGCNRLMALDQDTLAGNKQGQRYAGLQIVALDQIVGSVGRPDEFDRAFFPRQTHTMNRWLSLARASNQLVSLPPVDLVKVGNDYFVSDGHHRVSVARAMGQEFIEANVVEVVTAVPLPCPC